MLATASRIHCRCRCYISIPAQRCRPAQEHFDPVFVPVRRNYLFHRRLNPERKETQRRSLTRVFTLCQQCRNIPLQTADSQRATTWHKRIVSFSTSCGQVVTNHWTAPADDGFYASFKEKRRTGRVHWDVRGLKLLRKGMGMDEDDADEVMLVVYSLLPRDQFFNALVSDDKRRMLDIARQVENSPEVGRLFPRRDHEHQPTKDFFTKAAYHFVLIGNGENRKTLTKTQPTPQPQQVQQPPPQVSQPQQPQQQDAEDVDMQEAPAIPVDETEAAPGTTEDVPIKIEDDQENNPPQLVEGLFLNMIQLQSGRHGMTCGVMDDVFSTDSQPLPRQVSIGPLRLFWNNYLRSVDVAPRQRVYLNFKSPYHLPLRIINDDMSLRLAYRSWLRLGDPQETFVLIVKDQTPR